MKSKLLSALFAAALSGGAFAQVSDIYENPGSVVAPPDIAPTIDAYNFVNDGQFIINFTNQIWFLPPFQSPYPFETQNTVNYTNSPGAFMAFNTGARFQRYDPNSGLRYPASSFFNAGTIHCGTSDTLSTLNFEGFFGLTNLIVFGSSAGSQLRVSADKIINSGEIDMGFESLCSLNGNDVNLDNTTINMETNGFSNINFGSFFFNGLIFDGYWGLTNNGYLPFDPFTPAFWFEATPYFTPPHVITNRNYVVDPIHQLGGPQYQAYLSDTTDLATSNRWVRAVFLNNTNSTLRANVYFPIGATVIEWTNTAGTDPNNLYLFDVFLYQTNFQLLIDGFISTRPTYIPFNFTFFRFPGQFFFFGPPAAPTVVPFGTFDAVNLTNEYSAYEGLFQPISVVLSDVAGQTPANTPGRVEINATNLLSLSQAQVTSLNFLHVSATNQFAGSPGAQITSPYSEFNLRSTNGSMTISNLTQPVVLRHEGICDLYSARWTNVVAGITNNYHVLFANARLAPYAPTRMLALTLRVTNSFGGADNLVINDAVTCVTNRVLLDCSRLTIATNGPDAAIPTGSLDFLDSGIIWSGITPRLQYFTNYGRITAPNTMFFQGSRTSPYYSSNFNEAYYTFENHGGVTNFSSRIYATNFVNSGFFVANGGSIELHQATAALLTNGGFVALGGAGSITLEAGSLTISNHVLRGNAPLTLNVTSLLDDSSLTYSLDNITNKNSWLCSGFNLLSAPASGSSLLATTVTDFDPTRSTLQHSWAAPDRGGDPAAFANNSAVGHLILIGQAANSIFRFTGTGAHNAIYVDEIDFQGSTATNVDSSKNYLGVQIDPNMKIYYAQALANGVSIAERLHGKNNGGFYWVSNYNGGFFSSTNVVYPDGTTNKLNAALVASCDIDSNGNGIPNCIDPAPIPILSPAGLGLTVTATNRPSAAAMVSWTAFPGTSNTLLSASSPNAANWTVVTNVYYPGPFPGKVTVPDLIRSNGPKFYRLRVSGQ